MYEFSGVPSRRCAVCPRVGDIEPVSGSVIKYKLSPEELAALDEKYGNRRIEKVSPIAKLTDHESQVKAIKRKEDRRKNYKAYAGLNLDWAEETINKVIDGYNDGAAVPDIAESISREQEEVAFLIMDMARQGIIEPRDSGVYGRDAS